MWFSVNQDFVEQCAVPRNRFARPTTRARGSARLWKHWCRHQECLRIVENPSSLETQGPTRIACWLWDSHVTCATQLAIVGTGFLHLGRWHVRSDTKSAETTILSLYAYVQGFCIPVLYFLVPGKTKVLYKELLRITTELAPCVTQKPWLFDFQASMMQANQEIKPGATMGGCFFHLSKAVLTKVELIGCRTRYMEDTEFRLRVLALSSLTYLPLALVDRTFDSLKLALPPEEHLIPE